MKRILYIQYTNPGGYPPVEHSTRILADDGWEVRLLGIALQPELRFPDHQRIHVTLLPTVEAGWQQKVHYFYYWVWVFWWVLRWRPQWIYASDPLSTPIALSLSYLPFIKVLYHEHDSPSPNAPLTTFMRGVTWVRQQLAQRAQLAVLPNTERGIAFQQQTGIANPPLIVWNCPRLDEILLVPKEVGATVKVLYQGSIVPERLPLTVIDALAQLPSVVSLHIYGYETGNSGYVTTLRLHAQQLGVAERVHWHGVVPRYQLMKAINDYDIGLALTPLTQDEINLRWLIGASNKVFDYLARGVPLLVNADPAWESAYVQPGYGRTCLPNIPESIVAAIQWYIEHPVERQQMGEQGRQQVLKEWHYERQFQLVLSVLVEQRN